MKTRVYLEAGARWVFASAAGWPGWARRGRGEDEALAALLAYGARYADVMRRTSVPFTPPSELAELEVVERLKGGGTTDFGAPGKPAPEEERTIPYTEHERLREILTASWRAFDDAVGRAEGRELRKGPRGGGRDAPKIVSHLLDGEIAYLALLGRRRPTLTGLELTEQMQIIRRAALEALAARAAGDPVPDPRRAERSWPPRYFVRRSAWHALDHAWEIEDRVVRPHLEAR